MGKSNRATLSTMKTLVPKKCTRCSLLLAGFLSVMFVATAWPDGDVGSPISVLDSSRVQEVYQIPVDMDQIRKRDGASFDKYGIFNIQVSVRDEVAFSVYRSSIWVVSLDGSGLRCVVCEDAGANYIEWSRDGEEIVIVNSNGGKGGYLGTVSSVRRDGSNYRQLGKFHLDHPGKLRVPYWRYSPDGKYELMAETEKTADRFEKRIHIVSLEDRAKIATYAVEASIFSVAWFPNSQSVLVMDFRGSSSGGSRFRVMSLDGKAKTIMPDAHMILWPKINSSGKYILYADDFDLHLLKADGTRDVKLLRNNSGVFAWNPRGDSFVIAIKQGLFLVRLKNLP